MDCSPPGSSAHGIFQARILEWVAFSSPGDLPDPRIEPVSPVLAGGFSTTEPPGSPYSIVAEDNKCHGKVKRYRKVERIRSAAQGSRDWV